MRKILLILGAVILALSGALLIGALLFIVFAGVSEYAVMSESRSVLTRDSRAPADVAVLERGEIGSAVGACGESGWQSRKRWRWLPRSRT